MRTAQPTKCYRIFFMHSRAANSAVRGRIRPKFIHVRDIIVVLLTSKNEDDQIKNEGARLLTSFPHFDPMGDICSHMQPFPYPNASSEKLWLRSARWLRRYSCFNLCTTTDGRRRRTPEDGYTIGLIWKVQFFKIVRF